MSNTAAVFPKHRQNVFAINSWGYKDCYFYYDKDKKCLRFKGDKYSQFNNVMLPQAETILNDLLNIKLADMEEPHSNQAIPDYEFVHIDCELFRDEISKKGIDCSISLEDRYFRSSGQSVQDLVKSCHVRIPDIVLWPTCHNEVEFIVELANIHNVVLIPYGGGTNVTCSVNCPETEFRTIVSLDTTQMHRLLWLDEKSQLACFETGIGGQSMEDALNKSGYTIGHEPDSFEFSTLGGWIATRSSGIKQRAYGNIENIVVKVKVVTSIGTLDKKCTPRASMGPEVDHLMFGSEGTLGIITEAVVRVHKFPEERRYGSFLFPDFQSGINFMRNCQKENCVPASLRLIDNYQLKFGSAMSYSISTFDKLKEKILLRAIPFVVDMTKCCLSVYLIEGSQENAGEVDKKIKKIARKHSAWNGGPRVGEKGFFITFTVGYMRDMIIRAGSLQDSLETSVTWDKCEICLDQITKFFNNAINKKKVDGTFSYRISQVYHEGVCIYFYFGIGQCENQRDFFIDLCSNLKSVLVQSGASLSHHHGIGKRGQDKLISYLPRTSTKLLQTVKNDLDPKNIFAVGNLIFGQAHVSKPKL